MISPYAAALPISWKSQVASWFTEDCTSFDYAGYVVGDAEKTATLYGTSNGVLAGIPFFNEIFALAECTVEWLVDEGSVIQVGTEGTVALASVTGPVRKLLLGQRIAISMLSRCSAIATKSKTMRDLLTNAGYNGILAGTRKTTPGFRLVEKYGMMVGGVDGHRYDLSSMIMMKDNHIWAGKKMSDSIKAAKAAGGHTLKVEVEVDSEAAANSAAEAGADVIMLDNFDAEGAKVAAENIKKRWGEKLLVECSGSITADNITSYASKGKFHHFQNTQLTMICIDIDVISTSSVHQGVQLVYFSIKLNH
ncbi:hypothetical protein BGHDH14_bgh00250 [Blumeria hordei DH14]|uniref:Nicotinate-nucleotide pyrophosphorylase [carboxylating] n=1 Tax=Blumeria graminis f. sp. hordei (strain DH14) TaxID=546991 RepID=N1JNL3_BLUG1|nr:hypothetical protein BGHDH14_bgh00250 [Blumeria hordei DH14]